LKAIAEPDRLGKTFDVGALRGERIIGVGRPIGVAVAALVERHTMEFAPQSETAQVPGMRGQRAAMQKKNWLQPRSAPVEITKAQTIELDSAIVRQRHLVEAEAGADRGGFQMVAVFFTG